MPTTDEEAALIANAAQSVQSRDPFTASNGDVILPAEASLEDHIRALQADPAAQPYFAEGWQVALADLTRVCAFQPTVITDHTAERMAGVKIDDLVSIAAVTLPIAAPNPINAQFDQQRNAFIVTSANPNLRVLNGGVAPSPAGLPGVQAVFFQVSETASYVQVVEVEGRYFLRDGYHRAVALVTRGVRYAPVFFHSALPREACIPPGMLPYSAYAGSRPPMLADYADDRVACDVRLPAIRKLILIQANELTVIG